MEVARWEKLKKEQLLGKGVLKMIKDKDFFITPDGKEWRVILKTRKKFGAKWATHRALRWAVYERDNYTCQICGDSVKKPDGYMGERSLFFPDGKRILELDHIVPFKHGGVLSYSNAQCLCNRCNARKGSRKWRSIEQ